MAKGTVLYFDDERNFGFIAPDGARESRATRVFMHRDAIEGNGQQSLAAGARVQFDVTASPRGLRAKHVALLEADERAVTSTLRQHA